MSFINHASREINCKIVYYGAGLCGKTTNLQYIYGRTPQSDRGKMISLETEAERTLFFDFLPLRGENLHGFQTRFHLYTVPGQIVYKASRRLILKGVDGIVFVADSEAARMDANLESLEDLETNLRDQGDDLNTIPLVVQYNKRDLEHAAPLEEMDRVLNRRAAPRFESTATHGRGVLETLYGLTRQVLVTSTSGTDHERVAKPLRTPLPTP